MLRASTWIAGLAILLAAPAAVSAEQNRQPEPARQAQPAPRTQQGHAQPAQADRPAASSHPYGSWNNSWGATPPAPPSHWTRKSDWYRHVRACQQRYRSYNARTDTYRTNAGRSNRCAL